MNITHNCPGSKWWKFDCHAHTPASADYGKGSNAKALQNITPREWLLSYMKAGIDCVAVCDHNSGDWIDRLKDELENLKKERPQEFRELFIFPGVELSVTGNIHVLGIFPEDETTSDIVHLLGAVRFNGINGTGDQCTEASFVDVISAIHDAGGLAIPAHVDLEKGIFHESTGATLTQYLKAENIFAMEVRDRSFSKPQEYINQKLNWTEIVGSDAHHPSGFPGDSFPGSHFTWIKMSKPNFDGLRLALLDGEMSTRRFDKVDSDPNNHSNLVIRKIAIENTRYLGRPTEITLSFNPWLNSIIGGRGTGKSTVVEFIRKTLARTDEIPKSLSEDFKKYTQPYITRNDDGLFTSNTKLLVYITKDDIDFRIIWDQSSRCNSIQMKHEETWEDSNGDIVQRFPVRIYSQKQIFEMAKNPDALLQIIDESPEVDFYSWNRKNEDLKNDYLLLVARGRKLRSLISEEKNISGQLQDIKQKIEILNKSMHADILKKYRVFQQQKNAIQNWLSSLEQNFSGIEKFVNLLQIPEMDKSSFSTSEETDSDLLKSAREIEQKLINYKSELSRVLLDLRNEILSIREKTSVKAVLSRISENESDYQQQQEQLRTAGLTNPDDYTKFIAQQQEYEKKIQEIEHWKKDYDQIKKEVAEKYNQIFEHRNELTHKRQSFLQHVLNANSYVRITVLPFQNTNAMESEFRKIIHRDQGGFEKDIGGSIEDLANSGDIEQGLGTFKNKMWKIHQHDETAVKTVMDKRFAVYVQELSSDDMDQLRLWYPGDSLKVEYKSPNEKKFLPVEQGSPGQKTAALLSFILSYGDEPLILDQPEDDLDNQLIYDLIVSQLRAIKSKRQIIVVTHNANIVVNGDSENVLVLDALGGQTKVIVQGGLQDPSTRKEICRIMEGGRVAFEQRYKRIISGL